MSLENNPHVRFVRVLLILACCLVGLSCFFVWRMELVAYRLEQTLAAIADDVTVISHTAARISGKVDKLLDRVDRLEEKSRALLPLDTLETVLDEMKDVKDRRAPLAPERAAQRDREVKHLLRTIRRSGYKYQRGNKLVAPLSFYGYLLTKYKLYKTSLASAEDFIDKVATQTMTGKRYHVFINDEKVALPVYLRQELTKSRAKD